MQVIEHIELDSAASSITFSSIPDTYTDLLVVYSLRTTLNVAFDDTAIRFNGSSSGYSGKRLRTRDGAVSSQADRSDAISVYESSGASATGNTFGNGKIYISNYSGSTAKSVSLEGYSENNNSTAVQGGIIAGLWNNTSAISSISLFSLNSQNFVQYSSATLYGINKYATTGSPKATGGIISYVDGYWVHSFTSSGTFTPSEDMDVDYLVVAGGGSGFYSTGAGGVGGGGAGGLRSSVASTGGGGSIESALSLTASTGYTVTVGAGGASSSGTSNNGSNSVFSTITSTGGGGGGGPSPASGASGGSGGGGGEGVTVGGAGTTNQGFAGAGSSGSYSAGAGGGGSGSEGTSPSLSPVYAGDGGDGVINAINGSSTYYAAGGGGSNYTTSSTGGLGGSSIGGNGTLRGIRTVATAGAINTGSGGGALGGSAGASGTTAGGSGIVIVRYAA